MEEVNRFTILELGTAIEAGAAMLRLRRRLDTMDAITELREAKELQASFDLAGRRFLDAMDSLQKQVIVDACLIVGIEEGVAG